MFDLHVYVCLFSALSPGGYAGQVQGGYGRRFKETLSHKPTKVNRRAQKHSVIEYKASVLLQICLNLISNQ